LKNLNELMEVLAIPVIKKIGMTFIGAWKPEVGDDENTLIYLLGHQEWERARRRGRLSTKIQNGSKSAPSPPTSMGRPAARACS
jgi:hypothetical protein